MSQTESSQGVCFRKEEREPSWGTDLLGRMGAAHQLERLIANAPGPYVIAMTSEWGSGKTFFLKAWEKDLLARKRPCVYFNAWETDHAGDPLLALTGCITDSLKEQDFIEPNKLKDLAESASKIVAQSPGTIAKLAVGVANHFSNGALKEIKEILEDSVKLGTDLFLKNKQRRSDFANQLKKIAAEASAKASKQDWNDSVTGTKKFPLFVMIDELDRCRPSYVIELLENIKHLFGVQGVVFLLAIDQDQILGVIQHTFGLYVTDNKRDVRHDYLRKFIDIFWRLPVPNAFSIALTNLKAKKILPPQDWHPSVIKEIDVLSTYDADKINFLQNKEDAYLGILSQIASDCSNSLRECIQVIERFFIIHTSYNLSWNDSIAIFAMLFSKENNKSGLTEMLRLQGIEPVGVHSIARYCRSISSVTKCLLLIACFGRSMSRDSTRNDSHHPGAERFLTSLGAYDSREAPDLDSLYNKIQFIDNFYFIEHSKIQTNPDNTH